MGNASRSRRLTQEEFWEWLEEPPPKDLGKYELIHGRVVVTPPAKWSHGGLEVEVIASLHRHVRANGLGRVFGASTGYDLPTGDTLEPDASFISSARWSAGPVPAVDARGFLPIVPDLVVEVLSPSTARRDRKVKPEIYARSGVDEYWVVDAKRRSVTLHARLGDAFDAGVTVVKGEIPSRVLPQLALRVEKLFEVSAP